VSSGTSGQGRGRIDMTTPSCGQTRGKATARKIMNYARAATLHATRVSPNKPAGSYRMAKQAIKIRNEDH
jgi:hypothetical protein